MYKNLWAPGAAYLLVAYIARQLFAGVLAFPAIGGYLARLGPTWAEGGLWLVSQVWWSVCVALGTSAAVVVYQRQQKISMSKTDKSNFLLSATVLAAMANSFGILAAVAMLVTKPSWSVVVAGSLFIANTGITYLSVRIALMDEFQKSAKGLLQRAGLAH